MKRPGKLAEMIAKKAFDTPQFQQSWAVHMQAFGPILAPAYQVCFTAKVHLTNILNKISRHDVEGAKATMQTLLQSCGCESSEEQALLAFLQGLCCEVAGDQMHMFALYTQAGYHQHRFYLPHLKCARFAHESGQLDIALAEYSKALPLIRELPEGPARTKLLGSALTNTASCLMTTPVCGSFPRLTSLLQEPLQGSGDLRPESSLDTSSAALEKSWRLFMKQKYSQRPSRRVGLREQMRKGFATEKCRDEYKRR